MAWVRIDDATMDHPKILKLSDAQVCLWLRGLCYCQKHLTDGFIPDESLKVILARAEHVKRLVEVGLWDVRPGGYLVHDYLDWNDSRETTTGRRQRAKDRKQAWIDKHAKNASGEEAQERVLEQDQGTHLERVPNTSLHHTTPHHTSTRKKDPPSESLSSPPTRGKQYGRIFVHPWQLHELINTLGPHASNFGLDEWVFGLTALADSSGLVLEKKDVWDWVQSELVAEVRRRGLPIAGAADDSLTKAREEIARQDAMSRRAHA